MKDDSYKVFEKVNPRHPDKVADRIAGSIVDLAYSKSKNPKVAVEVLLGHGECNVIIESSEDFKKSDIEHIVTRIEGPMSLNVNVVRQDVHLAKNQDGKIRCGDNGVFRGVPVSDIERNLTDISKRIFQLCPFDGKYVLVKDDSDFGNDKLIVCQSHLSEDECGAIRDYALTRYGICDIVVNPLGYWTGGPDVDSGATNRKLGSDMGGSITGGGLHGKDLTKSDVSVNIMCWILANRLGKKVESHCGIGDDEITFVYENGEKVKLEYGDVVSKAFSWIKMIGGFEKLAEWGLIGV